MDTNIDILRTSMNVKNSLTRIKSITGISNWNILCRWAFCLSVKQTSLPREVEEKLDGIEIDYDTLVGKNKSIYTQLLINNLVSHKEEINKKNLTKYLNAHVNRGVNIIYTNKLKDISGLMALINS
jgi:DNA sulfur modification protein DndE|tara:strand:- start:371 stop:748 length:378 start_codon:yes stop_codon:yes gene_type:complete